MLRIILALFLALPLLEMYLLLQISNWIGLGHTALLVLLTGVLGAEIIRREGYHVLWKLQHSVSTQEISRNILEGGILVVSGLFLLTPGILTDIIGFVIVLRPVRERLVPLIIEKMEFSSNVYVQSF